MSDHKWVTGNVASREGLSKFTHIIRADDDPERLSRKQRQELHGAAESALAWKFGKLSEPVDWWRSTIITVLSHVEPCTFNRLVLEATGMEFTADIALDRNPDKALWDLVADKLVEHTMVAPILFRRSQRD